MEEGRFAECVGYYLPLAKRDKQDAPEVTGSAGCAVRSWIDPRIESLPLDGPQQEPIEFLVLWGAQEFLPLFRIGKVPGDQATLRVGQSVGQPDPRISLAGDSFCLGDQLLCAALIHHPHLPTASLDLADLIDQ